MSRVAVTVNSPSCSAEFVVCENPPQLLLHPMQVQRYVYQFLPDLQDIGNEIQIGAVLLQLGSPQERNIVLRFTAPSSEAVYNEGMLPELQYFR